MLTFIMIKVFMCCVTAGRFINLPKRIVPVFAIVSIHSISNSKPTTDGEFLITPS